MIYDQYNPTTGIILGSLDTPFELDQATLDTGYLLNASGVPANTRTQYVNLATKALAARPAFPSSFNATTLVANGTASITIGSLPNPTLVTIFTGGAPGVGFVAPFTVTDGSFVFKTPAKGTYEVMFESGVYQTYIATVTAT